MVGLVMNAPIRTFVFVLPDTLVQIVRQQLPPVQASVPPTLAKMEEHALTRPVKVIAYALLVTLATYVKPILMTAVLCLAKTVELVRMGSMHSRVHVPVVFQAPNAKQMQMNVAPILVKMEALAMMKQILTFALAQLVILVPTVKPISMIVPPIPAKMEVSGAT